ncbi:putative oxidoreductase YghA [Micromonospora sp. MH33]|uniref:SDR family oxidoreductase n=1 Tax=Micromonospora sp. MH33 TaxID=1945509 RepID=UPI000D149206|nr:SDR family oxidoreductase [Micromonospora sp. MH33]PSK64066.1 putative oxidoreductase YghA [Micromonospora sp. MH33]
MADQDVMGDPTTQYPKSGPGFAQQRHGPGLELRMGSRPDAGEDSYRGTGRLTGRKAVVTGADTGISRAVAIAYAREGANVVLSYLPEEEADAQEVVQLIEDAGRRAVPAPGDVTDDYCTSLIDIPCRELGGVDVVADVAGKQQEVPDVADLTTEQFEETFETDMFFLFWLCRAAVPQMPSGSAIISTTLVEAYEPAPILLDYAAAKAAINILAKSLARQVAPMGIRVNAVALGPVWTPLQVVGGQPTEALARFGSQTPLGRPAQPAEMALAFVFLTSQEASYVIAETLSATGGIPTS